MPGRAAGGQGLELWQRVLGRVLQSTCSKFWKRVLLVEYLGLENKKVRQFCRYVAAAIGETRREEGTEAESAAVDKLYMHIVRELLAQNGGLFVSCEDSKVCIHFRDKDRRNEHVLSRDRSRIEKVIFYFWALEEIDETLLVEVWKWMHFVFPGARIVALEPIGHRLHLRAREMEAVLQIDDIAVVHVYHGTGRSPIEKIDLERLLLAKGFGMFGANVNQASVGRISQCKVEALVLGLHPGEQAAVLHHLLQGEIRRSLRRLRVEGIEHLCAEDIWALARLENVKEIDLVGMVGCKCLRIMGESSKVAEVLQGAKVRMEVWVLSDSTVELLCGVWVDDLELYGVSVRIMASLFLHAVGSRLALRLRRLKMWILRQDLIMGTVDTVPFPKLEHLSLWTFSGEMLEAVHKALGESVRERVTTLSLQGCSLDRWDRISLAAGFANIEELRLTHCKLQRGELQRVLAGKTRLRCFVANVADTGARVTVEDARAIAAVESLREVAISGLCIGSEALGALVTNRELVDRLERLNIRVVVDVGWKERIGAELETLGAACRDGRFRIDTETVRIVVE